MHVIVAKKTYWTFQFQICDGLIFAIKKFKEIGRDFVHRDIKPTNILISKNGLVKVTDFGISKVYSNLYNHNKIGDSKELYFSGTLPYMSPEHFIGDSMLDTRSDIYSIGCVIYQMICGKTPFFAPPGLNTNQLLSYYEHHHFKVNPIHPILLNSNCTQKLNSITLKCINKDKNLRYNDFNELRDDLNECYFELKGTKYFGHEYQVEPLNELENELRGYSLYKLGKYVNALSFLMLL
ncbi:MAG: protein kinase [Bacteroidales bacterium]|nr:protein kinase [Bacteroidales bacterium]